MAIKVLLLSVLLWAAGVGAAAWPHKLGDEVTALLPGGEPMEFVWIPPGSFVMGSTPGEASERRALGLWENSFGSRKERGGWRGGGSGGGFCGGGAEKSAAEEVTR